MRVLFLFLLLLNLAYFGWQHFYPPAVTPERDEPENAGDNGVPSLTLLSERDRPKTQIAQAPRPSTEHAAQSAPPQPAKPVPPVIRRCLAVGPARERAVLNRLRTKLAAEGVDATIGKQERQVATGFWVHLPATRSEGKARADMRALRAKGVRDIAIAPTEDRRFVVSLGVFSRADTSADRLTLIRRLGYKQAVRDERYKSVTEYTLTASAEGKVANRLEATVKDMKAQLGKVSLDLSPCSRP